ncbi:hypothetical protein ACFY4C_31800 [Actinomadura viridis]|uniref:hypothetical protein n=1 Tax=Actinomadura viridis TaxID=58110 RepID=UPI00369B70A8
MRAKVNRKSLAAGIGAASLLGVGLYIAVPAASADPSPSPGATASAKPREGHQGKGHWRGHRGRWAADRGVHGEATVKRKDGFHVRTWQRGEITGRSGANVTVRSADGTVWTWTTDGKTRVRKDAAKSQPSALASGDRVVVVGERTGTTRTAKVIAVPKKK